MKERKQQIKNFMLYFEHDKTYISFQTGKCLNAFCT